jgi:hypothetical protein
MAVVRTSKIEATLGTLNVAFEILKSMQLLLTFSDRLSGSADIRRNLAPTEGLSPAMPTVSKLQKRKLL